MISFAAGYVYRGLSIPDSPHPSAHFDPDWLASAIMVPPVGTARPAKDDVIALTAAFAAAGVTPRWPQQPKPCGCGVPWWTRRRVASTGRHRRALTSTTEQ